MRTLTYSLTAVATLLLVDVHPASASCDDPFADPDDVLELHLRTSRATWQELIFDEPVPNGECDQYPYHEVEFRCGESEPWLSIGARHKRGDQRGMDTDEKPPLKLDFNRYIAGQRWPAALGDLGFRKLSLNHGQPDGPGSVLAVLLSEALGWRLLRMEVPAASGVAYAKLFVHFTDDDEVEYHGLYILIEDIDRTALRRRWVADEGILYKNTGGDCDGIRIDDGPPNEAADLFAAWDGLSSDDFPGGWYDETDRAMHLEELIRQEVVREIMVNDDNIFNDLRNYYTWDPRVGKRHWLPWDLDDVFRVVSHYDADQPLGGGKCSAIGSRIRCQPELRQRYMEVACQVINGTMNADRILDLADHMDAVVRPIIPDEVDLVWSGRDPLDPTDGPNYQTAYEHLHAWVPDRIAAIRAEVEAEGISCPDGCESGATEACDYWMCAGERVCEDGLWSGCRPIAPDCPSGETPGDADAGPGPTGDGGVGPGSPDAGPGDDGGAAGAQDGLAGGCGCIADRRPGGGASGSLLLAALLLLAGRRRVSGRRACRGGGCPRPGAYR